MERTLETEKTLAAVANWGLLGSFGLGFVLSGFSSGKSYLALIGFGFLLVGFVAHIIINRVFGVDFSYGEIAVGFIAFGVGLLAFVLSWAFGPGFTGSGLAVGIAGFAALILALAFYVVTKYGLKDSFSMFHQSRR